jgi:hypothetical protein
MMDLSPERCLTRLRMVDSVTHPQSRIRDLAAFTVENGRPGAKRT